ncbi:MAG: hypothetical protein MI810_16990 [Flavobacteriales bacterium]|nr:hypothetical protein [Flavobacteriales bacterium]
MQLKKYYINKYPQENGDYEVHASGSSCAWMPNSRDRIYLGEFESCDEAMMEAIKHYDRVSGCFYCAYECHPKSRVPSNLESTTNEY